MDGFSIPSHAEPVSAAPRAGSDLRAARERLAWPLPRAAANLRIRPAYLAALESGDLSRLPGNAYALGFLRSYARALGLDPDEMLRRFKAEAAEVTQRTELAFPAPVPDSGLPMGAVILLGVVLAIGAYIGWYRLSGEGRLPAETATAIPERLTSLADQALPPAPAVAPPPVAVPEPEPVESIPTMPTLSPGSAAAAPVNPFPVNPNAVSPPGMAGPDQPRIVLRASADAWMQVRDKSGMVLLNRVLKPGETWQVPPRADLLLTIGNAAGTEILVDGTVTAPLGGAGVVRRDLPLDPEQIRDGRLGAPMPVPGVSPRAGQ